MVSVVDRGPHWPVCDPAGGAQTSMDVLPVELEARCRLSMRASRAPESRIPNVGGLAPSDDMTVRSGTPLQAALG